MTGMRTALSSCRNLHIITGITVCKETVPRKDMVKFGETIPSDSAHGLLSRSAEADRSAGEKQNKADFRLHLRP